MITCVEGVYVVTKKKKPTRHALVALEEYKEAAIDLAFKGTYHPDEHAALEHAFKLATKRMHKHLTKNK